VTHDEVARLILYLHQLAEHTTPDAAMLRWTIALAIANIIVAFGTLGTALATAIMAAKTASLARDTVNASILADIHHQEAQSGLVVWLGERLVVWDEKQVIVRGYLANVGPGTATNISIRLEGPNASTGIFRPTLASGAEYPPLTGEEPAGYTRSLWTLSIPAGQARDPILSDGHPRVSIEYSTIFERQRRTWYSVNVRSGDTRNGSADYIQEFFDLNRDARLSDLLRSQIRR